MKTDKTHKIHAQNSRRMFLFEVAKALQAAATQTRRAWAALTKIVKKHKIHKIHAPKNHVCVFLRSPKRHGQLRHGRTGLGP